MSSAAPAVFSRSGDMDVARLLSDAAAHALLEELTCYPKPGLVSLVDSGAHEDMDAETFLASIDALRSYFFEISQAGMLGANFDVLRKLGIEAEITMLAATGGVNTHRGAIFALGLLTAAAGRLISSGLTPGAVRVASTVSLLWGEALARAPENRDSHGAVVARRYGVGGARAEASSGFPIIRSAVLPAMRSARRRGADWNDAAVDGFFASLAILQDTNLLYRGGPNALEWSRGRAAAFRAEGGIGSFGGRGRAIRLHRDHVSRNLSPGGSADMLSAALFLDQIGGR